MRQNDLWPLRVLLIFSLGLTACAPPNKSTAIAEKKSFQKVLIQTNPFLLTTYQKMGGGHSTLTVYIEGDGRAWVTRHQLSHNPTPRQPLALHLAMQDNHAAVAYLARPCQYTPLHLDKACNPKIWSSHRFSEMVISAMNEAVTQLKKTAKAQKINLIGFSGGGAISTLIAARRTDIASLRTVAGDLNHETLSHYHQTTSLTGSLNPSDSISRLTKIPQCHFSGGKDETVPPFIAKEFVAKINQSGFGCAKHLVIPDNTHHQFWEKEWKMLLKVPLPCN